MRLPAVEKSLIEKGNPDSILYEIHQMVEKEYWKTVKNIRDGEGIALYFTFKRISKDLKGIPMSDRKGKEYIKWRKAVFERDNYKCVKCKKKGNLQAHHKKSYSKYPELRFVVDNGMTLCLDCHSVKHPHLKIVKTGRSTK